MLKTLSVSKVVYITFFDFPSPLTEEIQKNIKEIYMALLTSENQSQNIK